MFRSKLGGVIIIAYSDYFIDKHQPSAARECLSGFLSPSWKRLCLFWAKVALGLRRQILSGVLDVG